MSRSAGSTRPSATSARNSRQVLVPRSTIATFTEHRPQRCGASGRTAGALAAIRHIGSAAAIVAPRIGHLGEDGVAEHVARASQGVRDVRVQALDRAHVPHAPHARRERDARVEHRQGVLVDQFGAARGGVPRGARGRARQLGLGRQARRPAGYAAAALQPGDGGDQRRAGAVVERRERPAGGVVGQVLDDGREPERAAGRHGAHRVGRTAELAGDDGGVRAGHQTRPAAHARLEPLRARHGRLSGAGCATGRRGGRARRSKTRSAASPC